MIVIILMYCLFVGKVFGDTDIHGKLFGKGVCSIQRADTKQVLILQIHYFSEMSYKLCWSFPPWCKTPTGRELKEFITTPSDIKHEVLSLTCCPGYYSSQDQLYCIPACSQHCFPHKCSSPNYCSQCKKGYHGPTCVEDIQPIVTSSVSPPSSPTPMCTCPNDNYVCNSQFQCLCAEGFDGPTCQHIIPRQIIIDTHPCLYSGVMVYLFLTGLLISAVVPVIWWTKRRRNTFQPLDDRNV